jgi:hypothetical protein
MTEIDASRLAYSLRKLGYRAKVALTELGYEVVL